MHAGEENDVRSTRKNDNLDRNVTGFSILAWDYSELVTYPQDPPHQNVPSPVISNRRYCVSTHILACITHVSTFGALS